jgi:hypothetical protein
MKDYDLAVKCYPTRERYDVGSPVHVRVELENLTTSEIKIVASTVPWIFHHAISFIVSAGASEAVSFQNRLWVIDPPTMPHITIAPGMSLSGEVDLARYLYSQDGKSISEVPGTYRIQARVSPAISTKEPGEDFKRLEIHCEPFKVVIGK